MAGDIEHLALLRGLRVAYKRLLTGLDALALTNLSNSVPLLKRVVVEVLEHCRATLAACCVHTRHAGVTRMLVLDECGSFS